MTTPATPKSEAAESAALISQIASEARSAAAAGKKGVDDAEGQRSGKPRAPGEPGADDAPNPSGEDFDADAAAEATEDDDGEQTESAEGEETEGDGNSADDGDDEAEATELTFNADAVREMLEARAEGKQIDPVKLVAALGVKPEELGLSPAAFAAMRVEQKKSAKLVSKAQELEKKLVQRFGDQTTARKAASEGKLEPAIEFIEATFGMGWNGINKMVATLLEGKPVENLPEKQELRALREEKARREQADKEATEKAAAAEKETKAKDWIGTQIRKDKIAAPELSKALQEAGLPTVVELVYAEMREGYSKGLTDPKAALAKVRPKLIKQLRALQALELVEAKPAKKKAVAASAPREGAQQGIAGSKKREMSDAEMRKLVLKEAGLAGG